MDIHWTYDGCDEEDEARIEQHWATRQLEFEGKLATLSDEPSELRIAVEHDTDQDQWDVLASLHACGSILTAEATSPEVEVALDKVLASLATKIDRMEERPERVTLRRRGLEAIDQFLKRSRQSNQGNIFISFLAPLVQDLRPYVRRELRMHQIESGLSSGQLTVADVLHEVLVRAWHEFGNRSDQLPLDLWLIKLADDVIQRSESPLPMESLDDEQPLPAAEIRESLRDEWVEQASYPEVVELSDLLAGGEQPDFWDDLDMESKQTRLAEMLGVLPRTQRQALVLHVAHGFDPAEIADFQDRSTEQVEEDIATARLTLERRLWQSDLDDRQEELERGGR